MCVCVCVFVARKRNGQSSTSTHKLFLLSYGTSNATSNRLTLLVVLCQTPSAVKFGYTRTRTLTHHKYTHKHTPTNLVQNLPTASHSSNAVRNCGQFCYSCCCGLKFSLLVLVYRQAPRTRVQRGQRDVRQCVLLCECRHQWYNTQSVSQSNQKARLYDDCDHHPNRSARQGELIDQ